MKRRAVLLVACTLMVSLAACGKTEKRVETDLQVTAGTPKYADDKQIEMTAYCGPRAEGYRYWNGVLGEHPDDPKEGWPGWITKKDFQDYIDCGFTYLMSEYDGRYVDDFEGSDLEKYMNLAEEMKIPVLAYLDKIVSQSSSLDYRISDETKSYFSQMVKDLSKYKMFKGFTLRDEPTIQMAKAYAAVKDYLTELKPDVYFFTSLLPIYAQDLSVYTQEKTDDREAAYEEYVSTYSDLTGNFIYDSYPLISDPAQGTSVDTTWYQNLRIVAEDAKEKGYEPGITIQSSAFGAYGAEQTSRHKRAITSKADISFQLYSALAYGFKHINYFTYWQHWSPNETEDFYTAMIDYPKDGSTKAVKTDAYYAVKDANAEVKKFDHVLMNYTWEGTMAVTADNEAIIGCMKDSDGYDGYLLVNAKDPGQNITNKVSLKFLKASKAIVYVKGEEKTIDLSDGRCSFTLESGDGVFIIPIE